MHLNTVFSVNVSSNNLIIKYIIYSKIPSLLASKLKVILILVKTYYNHKPLV